MTFPNQKYASPKQYVDAYFKNHSKAVSSVDGEKLAHAILILQHLYESDRTLYVCGNGGSASISKQGFDKLTTTQNLAFELNSNEIIEFKNGPKFLVFIRRIRP